MAKPAIATRIVVHLLCLIPFGLAVYASLTGGLSFNPVEDLIRRAGFAALILFWVTLTFTPIAIATAKRGHIPFRRTTGLYTFFYAAIHLTLVIGVDYRFNIPFIIEGVAKKPYVIVGALAFCLIAARAVTSFRWGGRVTPRAIWITGWLIYPASLLVAGHYLWLARGSKSVPFEYPLIATGILLFLLSVRLKPIRRLITGKKE